MIQHGIRMGIQVLKSVLLVMYRGLGRLMRGWGLRRFGAVNHLHSFILSRLRLQCVNIGGHKIYLDDRDTLQLSYCRNHEPFETDLLDQQVKCGDIVLDIGANIGFNTLRFARAVGPQGRVFAFEPDPANVSLLRKNLEANGYENVEVYQCAVSNKAGKAKLFLSETNRGDHRLYASGENRQYVEVEAVALDSFFIPPLQQVDLIKMDIQGSEFLALQGMKDILNNSANLKLFTEFWPAGLIMAGASPQSCWKFLETCGFELYHINEVKHDLERTSLGDLLAQFPVEVGSHTNILAAKRGSTGCWAPRVGVSQYRSSLLPVKTGIAQGADHRPER